MSVCTFLTMLLVQHYIGGVVDSTELRVFAHVEVTRSKDHSTSCTLVNVDTAILYWEAIVYAEQYINRQNMLFGNTLRIYVLDTCKNGKILTPYKTVMYKGLAVVGPYSSAAADFTSKFLSLFNIATVSYGASAMELSNRHVHPYFFRTVPSDVYSAQVYLELATKFHWYYIGIVYSDCLSGRSMKRTFERLLSKQFCIRFSEVVKHEHDHSSYGNITDVISKSNVRVVYLFLTRHDCYNMLDTIQHKSVLMSRLKEVVFVLSPSCGTFSQIPGHVNGSENKFLFLVINDPIPKNFSEYFQTLNPGKVRNRHLESYFKKYWQSLYSCPTDNVSSPCNTQPNTAYNHLISVRPVVDAVYAIAEGLRRSLMKICTNTSDCRNLDDTQLQALKIKMADAMLPNENDDDDGLPKILTKDGVLQKDFGLYQYQMGGYVKVGYWNNKDYEQAGTGLKLQPGFSLNNSTCSVPCGTHEVIKPHSTCPRVCWYCKPCDPHMIVQNNTCVPCKHGYRVNGLGDQCLIIPVRKYIESNDALSIVVIVLSSLGLLSSFLILVVYIRNFESKVIKATSRELSLFSLGGLALMFVTPIVIVMGPGDITCPLQKIMFGLSLTGCYAPLVLKTNRIYRIFVSSEKCKLKHLVLVSTTSQLLLGSGMVASQLVMGVFWIMSDTPMWETVYPDHKSTRPGSHDADGIEECNISLIPTSFNILFPVVLMIASTYWAFKTRNLPQEFSEIKSIGATMYLSLFVSTCALALIAALKHEPVSVDYYIISFTYQLIAFVTLIGQYANKVKVLYWNPEGEEGQICGTSHEERQEQCNVSAETQRPGNGTAPVMTMATSDEDIYGSDFNLRRDTAATIVSMTRNMAISPASPKVKRFSNMLCNARR